MVRLDDFEHIWLNDLHHYALYQLRAGGYAILRTTPTGHVESANIGDPEITAAVVDKLLTRGAPVLTSIDEQIAWSEARQRTL